MPPNPSINIISEEQEPSEFYQASPMYLALDGFHIFSLRGDCGIDTVIINREKLRQTLTHHSRGHRLLSIDWVWLVWSVFCPLHISLEPGHTLIAELWRHEWGKHKRKWADAGGAQQVILEKCGLRAFPSQWDWEGKTLPLFLLRKEVDGQWSDSVISKGQWA